MNFGKSKMRIMSSVFLACSLFLAEQSYADMLFVDDFETGSKKQPTNGFGWGIADNGGGGDAAPYVSTDIAHSGNSSLKFTFGGGSDGDDAWSEQRFVLGHNMNEVYIQWYQYYPDGTEGLGPKWVHRNSSGPDNNKFLRLWADVYGSGKTVKAGVSAYRDLYTGNAGDSRHIPVYGTNQTNGTDPWGEPMASQPLDDTLRGKWVKFQFHIKTATSSNNDGVIQMWINDKLVIDSRSLALYPSGGVGNYWRNGYIMGWANSGFAQTSYTYIDDFIISDTYIGGNPPSAPIAE